MTCEIIWCQNNAGFVEEFFLVTHPEDSGLPPARIPPPIPVSQQTPIVASSLSKSQSLHSAQFQDFPVDDIDDFDEEDEEEEEVQSRRSSRRLPDSAADLSLKLPPFATGVRICGKCPKKSHECFAFFF